MQASLIFNIWGFRNAVILEIICFSAWFSFIFFWAHSFISFASLLISDAHAWSVFTLTIRNAISRWERIITRVYTMSTDYCGVGVWQGAEGSAKKIMFYLSFLFFQAFRDQKKKNRKIGNVTMYVRFSYICRITQNRNVSSVKENYYFQPHFLSLAFQFNICLEPDYSPI